MKTSAYRLRTCQNCGCCHEIERTRWNPDKRQEETQRVHQCWGVSEPFEIKDTTALCAAYPGSVQEVQEARPYTRTFVAGLNDIVYRPTGNKYPSKWKVMYIGFSDAGTWYNIAKLDLSEMMQVREEDLGRLWFLTAEEATEYIKENGANRSRV